MYASYEIMYLFITTIIVDGEFKGFKFEKNLERNRKFSNGNIFVFYKLYKNHFYSMMCEKGMRKEAIFILNEMNKKIKKTFEFHQSKYKKDIMETITISQIKRERNYRLKFYKTRNTLKNDDFNKYLHTGPIVKKEEKGKKCDNHMVEIVSKNKEKTRKLENMNIYEYKKICFFVKERISKGLLERLSWKKSKSIEDEVREIIYEVLTN